VSSAYKAVSDFSGMMSGKSLMNNTNNIGPSTLPCGTPDVTEDQPEATPSTTTLWVRPVN
jgi:hypothetical protein